MKDIRYGIYIFLVTLTISNPCFGNSEIKKNSHDFISHCFNNIRPAEESEIRPIFDTIQQNINPTLTEKEVTLLKEWVGTKNECIQLIDDALKINHIQFPLIDMSTMQLPSFVEYRNILGLLLVKAKISIYDNNHTDSIKNILEVIKYGNMIRYGDNSSILTYMIGTVIEEKGLKWLQNVLCNIKYENTILQTILISIQNTSVIDKSFIKSMNGELNYFLIPSIKHLAIQIEPIINQLSLNQKSIFDTNKTIKLAKKQFQQIINKTKEPWSSKDALFYTDSQDNSENSPSELECFFSYCPGYVDIINKFDIKNEKHVMEWKKVGMAAKGKNNLLGKILIFQSSPSFGTYHKRSIELRTKKNLTRTLVALDIFKNHYGEYPKQLNELVETKIIRQVPLDLFSNQPLLYSLSDFKLWSIGSDKKNNNANPESDIVLSCKSLMKVHKVKTCN